MRSRSASSQGSNPTIDLAGSELRPRKPLGAAASDDLLTTFEVAVKLRIRPQGVRELALRREMAFYRIGRKMLFATSDVAAFLASRRRPKD